MLRRARPRRAVTSFDTWPPIAIAATGSAVPERVVTNAELETTLATTDAWIVEHTGIRERRWVSDEEATSDLAARACRAALDAAGSDVDEVDLVIVATATPDWPQPATASAVHGLLGMRPDAGAMDVNAACSGFVHALHGGASMLAGCEAWTTVLVAGADCGSRMTDPTDRTTRIFFGDAAGAVVLRRELELADVAAAAAAELGIDLPELSDIDGGVEDDRTPGLRSFVATTHPAGRDAIIVPAGGSREPVATNPGRRYFQMDGPAVREFAVGAIVGGVADACRDAGCTPDELALVVPHQSNRRILEAAIDALDLPESRLATTVERFGNTQAASIPLTLDVAVRAGRLLAGDLVCLVGYGGGLSSAACVVRWA